MFLCSVSILGIRLVSISPNVKKSNPNESSPASVDEDSDDEEDEDDEDEDDDEDEEPCGRAKKVPDHSRIGAGLMLE